MSDQPKPTPKHVADAAHANAAQPERSNDAAHVPEPFLLTFDDLFETPPAPPQQQQQPATPQPRQPFSSSVRPSSPERRPAISLPAAVTADESEGGPPKVWATVNVDRLLAFSERYQPELLAPAALKSWFAGLAAQPLLACYKERSSRPAILALGFAAGNRADPFFDLPGEPVPVSLAATSGTQMRGKRDKQGVAAPTANQAAHAAPHMRMRFDSDRDIWIRSRREIVLVAPASPTESLRACRLYVEFGSLDATGHMTYTLRPTAYEVITPDQAHERPVAPMRRAA